MSSKQSQPVESSSQWNQVKSRLVYLAKDRSTISVNLINSHVCAKALKVNKDVFVEVFVEEAMNIWKWLIQLNRGTTSFWLVDGHDG